MVALYEITAMVRYAAFLDTAFNTVTCHRHMYTAKSSLKWPNIKAVQSKLSAAASHGCCPVASYAAVLKLAKTIGCTCML